MSRMLGVIWAEITTPTGQAGPLSAAYARALAGEDMPTARRDCLPVVAIYDAATRDEVR